MGHEDELTIEELQEILNEEHQQTQRNISPSEQEVDERGPMPTSAIKDLLKKWEDVRAMVLKWHPNQDVSRVGDLYNDNAINYFRKILKKREKQSTLDIVGTPLGSTQDTKINLRQRITKSHFYNNNLYLLS
ncbi:uncharacterized protein TNCV_2705201 [Trichonephila clavipes]|nr:uncharacterized protein TNCV_2705201 [Trichonephila clavipes]